MRVRLFQPFLVSACLACALPAVQAQTYSFSTLAGTAPRGANDGTGSGARFNRPTDVAVDAAGNFYVTDRWNYTVRKVTPARVVTLHAGGVGLRGSSDGANSGARFGDPQGLAVDSRGNLIVADASGAIRKITPIGVVTTIAGLWGARGSADGDARDARFDNPTDVVLDAQDNIYITDFGNGTIRKLTPLGAVSTVAGIAGQHGTRDGPAGQALFEGPGGLTRDAAGNLYVVDSTAATLRKIAPDGTVTTLAGSAGQRATVDGFGSAARFNYPWDVSIDGAGNLYIGDADGFTLRRVTPEGLVSTIAGVPTISDYVDGPGGEARFMGPAGLCIDSRGVIHLADADGHGIRTVTDGFVNSFVGGGRGGDDGTGANSVFDFPRGIALDSSGNLFVVNERTRTIRRVTRGGAVTTVAGANYTTGNTDATGNAARFTDPVGAAIDANNNLFVTDALSYTIRRITPAGVVTTFAGSAGNSGSVDGPGANARFVRPTGLAFDHQGNLFVTDGSAIRRITAGGAVSTVAGGSSAGYADGSGGEARFSSPHGLTVDASGTVYIADTGNHVIRRLTSDGEVSTFAGRAGAFGGANGTGDDARFNAPEGITIDSGGNLFVADTSNHLIRKITPGRLVSTIGGQAGLPGESNGLRTAALFDRPTGIALNASGELFVSEMTNNTIRLGVVQPLPTITAHPDSRGTGYRGTLTILTAASPAAGTTALSYRWLFNGTTMSAQTSPSLTLVDVQPQHAGLYVANVTSIGVVNSEPAIIGVTSVTKSVGSVSEVGPNIVHASGNVYDQFLMTGAAATMNADVGQILRVSYLDLNDDIVQVELSGAGSLTLTMESSSGPAAPVNYNQTTQYVKGHASIIITGANETTNVSIFSVGRATAVNQALFRSDVAYDGRADVAFLAILSTNGKFGGIRAANANFFGTKGVTGVYAPNVQFTGPVFVGDINALDSAIPTLIVGSAPDARITGGDLEQLNGQAVRIRGLSQLRFADGTTSHGVLLPAQPIRGRLEQDGADITSRVVSNPRP